MLNKIFEFITPGISIAKSLGLEHKVFFKGFVSGDNLVEAYQSLDIFVALSRRESFGVSVLEASSCQRS